MLTNKNSKCTVCILTRFNDMVVGMSLVLVSKGKYCRFLDEVGKFLLGFDPMEVDGSSGPAQHITFSLQSTKCCVGRGHVLRWTCGRRAVI